MSAQPSIAALPDREPRFAPPLPVRTAAGAMYHQGSPSVPPPASVLPLLRRDDPGKHWATVLASIFDRLAHEDNDGEWTADADRLRLLLERRCTDPAALPYVRRLVPVGRCGWCGGEYLRESRVRGHCSDHCRRAAAKAGTAPCRPNRATCLVCGEPVPAGRRTLCSEGCRRRGEAERRRDAGWRGAR